jgi:serine/threonine protein kinase
VSEASRSYIAPELLRVEAAGSRNVIDGRTDVFALGVIAHRALTGCLPIARGLGAEPYAPSHERRPDAPRELTALIDSMLAFERLDRPTSSEVRTDVDSLFATESPLQVPVEQTREAPLAATGLPVPPMSPDELVALAQRQRVRRPRWTPEIRYVETTDIPDGETIVDDVME